MCRAIFKYENERKPVEIIDLKTFYLTKMILRVEKGGVLGWTPFSVGDPDLYLGAKLKNMRLNNVVWAWDLSLENYMHDAVNNVKCYVVDNMDGKYEL